MDLTTLTAAHCIISIAAFSATIARVTSLSESNLLKDSEESKSADSRQIAKHRALLQWHSVPRKSNSPEKAEFVEAAVELFQAEHAEKARRVRQEVHEVTSNLVRVHIWRVDEAIAWRHIAALVLAAAAAAPVWIPLRSFCDDGLYTTPDWRDWLSRQSAPLFIAAWAAMIASYALLIRISGTQKQLLEDAKELRALSSQLEQGEPGTDPENKEKSD